MLIVLIAGAGVAWLGWGGEGVRHRWYLPLDLNIGDSPGFGGLMKRAKSTTYLANG